MTTLVLMGISNAVQVAVLATVVFLVARLFRNAAISRCLWLLVLLKLVTPPVLSIPLFDLPPSWNASNDVHWPAVAGTTADSPNGVHQQSIARAKLTDGLTMPKRGAIATDHVVKTERQHSGGDVVRSEEDNRARLSAWIAGGYLPSADDRLFQRVLLWVGFCWLVGSLLWFAFVIYRGRRFGRLLRRASRASQQIQHTTRQLATQLKIHHVPEVLVVDAIVSPFLWGSGNRAVIVLPRKLIDQLSDSQQTAILAHELTHLARHDLRTRWLEIVAIGFYWWHPAAWLARRELRNAEELCCDSAVISVFSIDICEYATTLLETACFLASQSQSLPRTVRGFGHQTSLKRRIKMIVKSRLHHRLSLLMRVGVALVAIAILPLSPFTFGEDTDSGQTKVNEIDRFIAKQLGTKSSKPLAASKPKPLFKSPGQLITNNGFEDSKSIHRLVPRKPGHWGGDEASIVGPEQGIRPRTGDYMLRLLSSGPQGPSKDYTASEVFQIVDLSKYRQFTADGKVTLTASAYFNRVHRNEKTDSAFSFTAYLCDGSPLHFHRKILNDETLGEVEGNIYVDKNPETWERVQFSMRLPRNATYLGIRVVAVENVSNDPTDEFHGHYVDDVSVTIHPRNNRSTSVPLMLYHRGRLDDAYRSFFSREQETRKP